MKDNTLKLTVTEALTNAGISVKVKDLGRTLRINLKDTVRSQSGDKVQDILNGLGFTSASGMALKRTTWNGDDELFAYKPGMIRIIR